MNHHVVVAAVIIAKKFIRQPIERIEKCRAISHAIGSFIFTGGGNEVFGILRGKMC